MIRAVILATLLFWAATAQAGSRWDALWHTPDQQGDQLLQNGHPAQAARVFHDPRRKAYAELEAGNYAQAAQGFAAFHDSDSEYNRGNALARSGDLEGAIKAYDAALARNPNNRDARHNRDLVAKALKKKKNKPQSATGKSQKKGKKQGQGKNNGQGKDQSQGTNKGKNKQNGKPHSQGTQTGSGQKTKGSVQAEKSRTGKKPAVPNDRKQTVAASKAGEKTGQHDGTARARADATATPGKKAQGSLQTQAPLSERQLAQKQWLRRIPDDPGGLLRRKFMIEHMLRQEGRQP